MPFNSPEYLLFFLVTLVLSWALAGVPMIRLLVLLLASYYFYASHTPWLLFLLVGTTQLDYALARLIESAVSPGRRKLFLATSIVANLGVLGIFKYSNFFASAVASLAGQAGLRLGWTDLNIVLPIGISFYTFESMSYTIDVYRRQIPAERSWIRYALFIAYFPHLIAGPIVRPGFFLPQLDRRPALDRDALQDALRLIFLGLFKKIVLADFLARYVDPAFDRPAAASALEAWLGLYGFAFQIYFDFSGYTDIAIGCARLMGFRLPENFRRPYAALGLTDFWRRWHMSLSSWLRDYLYIPLGGNRMGSARGVYRNILITMVLGGLWHGAAWHFVLWGALHGLLLVGERALGLRPERTGGGGRALPRAASSLLTFHAVTFCWMLFRARDLGAAAEYLRALARFGQPTTVTVGMVLAGLIVAGGYAAQHLAERRAPARWFPAFPAPLQAALYAAVAVLVTVLGSASTRPFIYFKF